MIEFIIGLFIGHLLTKKEKKCIPPGKRCSGRAYGCLYCSRWDAPLCPYHDEKNPEEQRPNGVKCTVYGCGFEWYKGSPMTDEELKEHRCIHFH